MFTPDRVVELVVLIAHGGEPPQRLSKQPKILATFRLARNGSKLSQAVVGSRMEVEPWFSLIERNGQEPPEIELVARRKAFRAMNTGVSGAAVTVPVNEMVFVLESSVFRETKTRIKWA